MKTIVKNGRVIDPSQNIDGLFDLSWDNGKITALAKPGEINATGATVIDAKGLIVTPGFVELHSHLREPGHEYKETVASGSASAVAGGYTSICCMANTSPANDTPAVTTLILQKAKEAGLCRVYPIGAVTKGLKGDELAPMSELKAAGCVAVSDDGWTVQNAQMMRVGLEYAKNFGLPVSTHSIDADLAKCGCMNESIASTKKGLKGSPAVAEDVIIARDILLAEVTGAHLHIGHLSTKTGIRLVAEAKRRGVKVTCEVTPHHFTLTDADIPGYDTHFKMCPPLRGREDVQAIENALREGLIDAIATDHAPHGLVDKEVEFDQAAFGIIGFESALPLSLRLVEKKILTLTQLVNLLTTSPAQVFGLPAGTLKLGAAADVTLFNPDLSWKFESGAIRSKSKNSPFIGQTFKGRVTHTFVGGEMKYQL